MSKIYDIRSIDHQISHDHLISKYFPYPSFRKYQKETIDFILQLFDDGEKVVAVEAPVGSGKSVIGYTVGMAVGKSYFLTTQKILQSQFINEFPSTALIWSSDNYYCDKSPVPDTTCAQGFCRFSLDSDIRNFCVYKIAKNRAAQSNFVVSNYSYILNEYNYSAPDARKFDSCDLLILDEAHNLPEELRKFLTFNISNKEVHDLGFKEFESISINDDLSDSELNGVLEKILHVVSSFLYENEDRFHELSTRVYNKKVKSSDNDFLKKYSNSFSLRKKINNYFEYSGDIEFIRQYFEYDSAVSLIPTEVNLMAYNILYKISKKILLLSSTFLDPKAFCHSSGIPEKFFNLIKMPSMFPKENRPIIVRAVGKMTDGKINELMPKLSKVVNDILKQHENDKGIIHVPSYKIARGLGIHDQSKRLLLHTNSSRGEVLRFFMESKDPLVMVSPSMYEGLDLRDDLSRFQIIVKIPWLGLDDVYVKMMSRKDFKWYIWRTAIKIVQGYGRSVRSEEDYAVTYVLDADFPDFIDRNKRLFPEYFLEAIKYEREAV